MDLYVATGNSKKTKKAMTDARGRTDLPNYPNLLNFVADGGIEPNQRAADYSPLCRHRKPTGLLPCCIGTSPAAATLSRERQASDYLHETNKDGMVQIRNRGRLFSLQRRLCRG